MTVGLVADTVSVRYGGVHALRDASLTVEPGQLVGLIGPNGAGKTTFIDAISGLTPYRGSVALDGASLDGVAADARTRRGLGRTWQSAELFAELSVRDNLSVAAGRRPLRQIAAGLWRGRDEEPPSVQEVLERLGIQALAEAYPDELTQGQRKLVDVARALTANPRVVCLDEPAAGLDTSESEELGRLLRAIVDAGTGVLLIDHDMGLVLTVSDRVVVLDFGQVIAQGTPTEIRSNRQVIDAYLGQAEDGKTA
jgi:branched-chain amino acid transport system ATP-binding protein